MAHPPPPPHERIWRHPSEVASAARRELRAERPNPRMGWVGAVSALIGFVAIGAALVWVLPPTGTSEDTARYAMPPPLATPIHLTPERAARLGLGDGAASRVAVTRIEGMSAHSHAAGTDLQVRLPDGSTAAARVIGSRAGISVVELPGDPGGEPLTITTVPEEDTGIEVRVLAGDPYTITLAQVYEVDPGLRPANGTAVVTLDGELLGFCVDHESEEVVFISADELLVTASDPTPPDSAPEP